MANNDKNIYYLIAGIILVFLLAWTWNAGYLDNVGLSGGSLLGVSSATDIEGVTYWVIPFTQQKFTQEQIMTATKTSTVSGKDSDGNQVSGTIKGDFKLNVNGLGWQRPVSKQLTDKYITTLKDEYTADNFWAFGNNKLDMKYTESSTGIPYYITTGNTWTPAASYDVSVTIDGETYKKTIDSKVASGTSSTGIRYTVYAGDATHPPIYYEESGYLFGSTTETAPEGLTGKEFFEYGGKVVQSPISQFVKTFNSAIKYIAPITSQNVPQWDFNGDGIVGTVEDLNNMEETFDQNFYKSGTINKYGDASNSKNYALSNDNTLIYETPIVVMGVWYIPIEYGDVTFNKLGAKPDILSHKISGDLLDTGKVTITFQIKNNGDEGPVNLGIDFSASGQAQHFTVEPTSKSINMKSGETQSVSFTMIASDVTGDYTGKATLVATGGTGLQDSYEFEYEIKDTAQIPEGEKLTIKITTVDENGAPLTGGYPIVVVQNGAEGTDELVTEVVKGNVEITGRKVYERVSEDMTVEITEDGQEVFLKYIPDGQQDTPTWYLWAIIAILAIVIIGGGAYFLNESNKKPRGKSKK